MKELSVIVIVLWVLLAGCGSEQAPVTLVKTLYGWETLKVQPDIITMAEHRVNREVRVELERQAKIDSLRPVCEERGHVFGNTVIVSQSNVRTLSGWDVIRVEEEIIDYPDSSVQSKITAWSLAYYCGRCEDAVIKNKDVINTEVVWRRE